MKPPIAYYGGKQKISKELIDLLPKDFNTFVEPYCGAATIYFAICHRQKTSFIINDKNEWLINFFKVLRDEAKCKILVEKLDLTPYSRLECRNASKLIMNDHVKNFDDIEAARTYFVGIEQAFSNTIGHGWSNANKSKNEFYNKIKRLKFYTNILKNCIIECNAAIKIIKLHDKENTFFFLDPPYPEANQGHYLGFTNENFIELMDVLKNIKGKFMLTCYQKHWMDFDKFNIVKIKTVCFADSSFSDREECIVMNYNIQNKNNLSFF